MRGTKEDIEARVSTIIEMKLIDKMIGEIAEILGVTFKQARYARDKAREIGVQEASKTSAPTPKSSIPDRRPTANFQSRSSIDEMTNWSNGWTRSFTKAEIISETDRKGQVHTKRVFHDPGVCWPVDWRGPKDHAELAIESKPARPIKWGMLVTSHQSHTPTCGPALMSMSALAGYYGISLVIAGIETKPPVTAKGSVDTIKDWPEAVKSWVTADRHDLGDIVLAFDFPVNNTSSDPLHGLMSYCRQRTHIFPSARQHLMTLPKFKGGPQAFAWSTGSMSMPNYGRTKAGMVAIEDHVIGGILVLEDFDGNIFTRNIRVDPISGDLWDLDVVVENGIVRDADVVRRERDLPGPVLAAGCTHRRWLNEEAGRAVFGFGGRPDDDLSAVEALMPSEQILHDVFDADSISPHNRKNPYMRLEKQVSGRDDLKAELQELADFIDEIGSSTRRTWIVESNHHRHLDRHLTETDWKTNPKNAEIFLRINLAHVEALNEGRQDFDALEYAIRHLNQNAEFEMSRLDEPLQFFRYYYHLHGDQGTNGSHGSDTNLKRTGMKIAAADNHAGTINGSLVRLFSLLDEPPYARGINTWAKGFGVEHPDGSMQLIPICGDKWRP